MPGWPFCIKSALISQQCRRAERFRGQILARSRAQTEVSAHHAHYVSRKYEMLDPILQWSNHPGKSIIAYLELEVSKISCAFSIQEAISGSCATS
jgi:hypothetical protein